jgi:imidazolonepropionase-like amidohydrolase
MRSAYGVVGARKVLEAGFTTARDVGASGFADIALRDAINDGDIPGPRILAAGPALGITGGHCDDNLLPAEYDHRAQGVADGPWAVRAKVRENIKYGADLIKFCPRRRALQGRRRQRLAVHVGRDASHRRRSPQAGAQGGRARPRQ